MAGVNMVVCLRQTVDAKTLRPYKTLIIKRMHEPWRSGGCTGMQPYKHQRHCLSIVSPAPLSKIGPDARAVRTLQNHHQKSSMNKYFGSILYSR